jgi:cytochrome c peroxidase
LQCVDDVGFRLPLSYFHNGFAADLDAVVSFYNDCFQIGFTRRARPSSSLSSVRSVRALA